MASKTKLEDLNLSQDEIKRLGEALKDEKFRNMFREYAEEISDPENRRRYEEEIAQMERERGMDVTFIRPEPGYVLKTSVDGDKKAFINISKSDKLEKPSSERKQNDQGKSGLLWHIPHSFAPARDDVDKQKNRCKVYDFVIHPDTYLMAERNDRFRKLVEETAMDGIEKQFDVKLDRKNVKRPKLKFKGIPTATVMRSRNSNGPQPTPDPTGLLNKMPYPYDEKTTQEKKKERDEHEAKEQEKRGKQSAASSKEQAKAKEGDATVPKYTIVHRSELDLQEYRNAPDAKPSTRPRELVIKIELPLLKSANQASLEIFEKQLLLESKPPAAYKLDLALPYPVDDSEGSAKFDKQKRTLTVTLPVILEKSQLLPSYVNGTTSNEECPENPLIEVLPNGTVDKSELDSHVQQDSKPDKEGCKPDEEGSDTSCATRGASDKMFSAHIAYTLPDFSFTQDAETVSFVLKVKNIAEDTIRRVSPTNHEVKLVCTSQGEGGFPLHYSLFLRFPDVCRIVPEHCSVDVTVDNVVLLLLKERQSRGLWDRFSAGLDADSLEERLFLTTSNLQKQLEELDETSAAIEDVAALSDSVGENGSPPCDLQVTTMNEKKLTIKISPHANGANKKWRQDAECEEEGEEDLPSSAEIQVVHTQPSPSLHSILKQRTISESSEDVNPDVDSPRSPCEEEDELSSSFGKRRSVSFSKHIDKAMFKSSASVSSMKTSLKSKRKRQRKWEEKQDKAIMRRRHNSTGSEGSGDDHTHSLSDSHSHSDEEEAVTVDQKGEGDQTKPSSEQAVAFDFRTNLSAATSSSTSSVEAELCSPSKVEVGGQKEEKSQCQNLKEQTGTESINGSGAVATEDIRPACSQSEGSSDKGSSIASKIKAKLAETPNENHHHDSDDDDAEAVENRNGVGDEGAKQSSQGASSFSDAGHNEHRTECAFEFSNAVMFDLDVE